VGHILGHSLARDTTIFVRDARAQLVCIQLIAFVLSNDGESSLIFALKKSLRLSHAFIFYFRVPFLLA